VNAPLDGAAELSAPQTPSAQPRILMVSGATRMVAHVVGHPALGRLVQPRCWKSVEAVAYLTLLGAITRAVDRLCGATRGAR
jgi:hypothetical protein